MVVSPYPFLIFYRATEDEIVIHGVRHRSPAVHTGMTLAQCAGI
jgi:hypothetical protein